MINKLEAAKRQLDQAIKLFFEDRDTLSIHTLAAATQGILNDINRVYNKSKLSTLYDNPHIPSEQYKSWVNLINAPRNFLKHADKDPEGIFEFSENHNEALLLDAVILYSTISQEYLSSANVYIGWLTTKYPDLRDAIINNQIGDYCVRNKISCNNKRAFLELIDKEILIDEYKA